MDRFYVGGGRRQSYYELFKACRLCGSGGGYKMPIVQASAHQGAEPELKQKIRDCCSIDVQQDDKMPPLICELCVDKVNDFYEFREMCHATNTRVRASLGLPPQTLTQDLTDDCILGVSGPLIYNSKELELSQSSMGAKVSNKDKKPIKSILSTKKRPPSPPLSAIRDKRNKGNKANSSLLTERLTLNTKRRRGAEPVPEAPPVKKLRFADIPAPKKGQSLPDKRTTSTPTATKKTKEANKKTLFNCNLCELGYNKRVNLNQHLIAQHRPTIFNERVSCNPCRVWFSSVKLADDHHKWHKSSATFYKCERCLGQFKVLLSYTKHFALRQCIPEETVPDKVCDVCKKSFATENLFNDHKCSIPKSDGGECAKCKRSFLKRGPLKRHQAKCRGSIEVNPNNPHLKELIPVQISMRKCDSLLERIKREPVDPSNGSGEFYDLSGIIITKSLSIKTEPLEDGYGESITCEVDIKQEIKEEFSDDLPDHNDYDDSDSNDLQSDDDSSNLVINPFARKNNTQVESLSFISLRTIFSGFESDKPKPRPRRKTPRVVKVESHSNRVAESSVIMRSDENKSSAINLDELNASEMENDASNKDADLGESLDNVETLLASEASVESEKIPNCDDANISKDDLCLNNNVIAEKCPDDADLNQEGSTNLETLEVNQKDDDVNLMEESNVENVKNSAIETEAVNNLLDDPRIEENDVEMKDIDNVDEICDNINDTNPDNLTNDTEFKDHNSVVPEELMDFNVAEDSTKDPPNTEDLMTQSNNTDDIEKNNESEEIKSNEDLIDFNNLIGEKPCGDVEDSFVKEQSVIVNPSNDQNCDESQFNELGLSVPNENNFFGDSAHVSENQNAVSVIMSAKTDKIMPKLVNDEAFEAELSYGDNKVDDVDRENSLEAELSQMDGKIDRDMEKENDILDLVSDSGDDCNIVEMPDKALEDQLLNQAEESGECQPMDDATIENLLKDSEDDIKQSDVGQDLVDTNNFEDKLHEIAVEKLDKDNLTSLDDITKELELGEADDFNLGE